MKKKTAYIILFLVIAIVFVLSIRKRSEDKNNVTETEEMQILTEANNKTDEPFLNQEEIIIASGEGGQATKSDTEYINETIEKEKQHHKNKTEIYENITFENMDIFTERSCDIEKLYNSIKNFLYKEEDERSVEKCVFDRETEAEGAGKKAVLYFKDGTNKQIIVYWYYYQYLIQNYEDHTPKDFDSSVDNPGAKN